MLATMAARDAPGGCHLGYQWSYSGKPVWYTGTPETERLFGLPRDDFRGATTVVPAWHRLLRERHWAFDPRLEALCDIVAQYDRGQLDAGEFYHQLGTPGAWLVLGPLGHPQTRPQVAAAAVSTPIDFTAGAHGRDGFVRWLPLRKVEPTGAVHLRGFFDWRHTDDAAADLVAMISAHDDIAGFLDIGWDDGIHIRLGEKTVLDRRQYPERGHGMLHRGASLFEERVPIVVPKGRRPLVVTSINLHDNWGFNIRFTDHDGLPLRGLQFSLPTSGVAP
jgi:hypothetical protein